MGVRVEKEAPTRDLRGPESGLLLSTCAADALRTRSRLLLLLYTDVELVAFSRYCELVGHRALKTARVTSPVKEARSRIHPECGGRDCP